jgi:hypothetical protein
MAHNRALSRRLGAEDPGRNGLLASRSRQMTEGIAADEEQRRALAETLPPGTIADRVIRKLECSKRRLLESRANRRSNAELKAERAKWRSRIKAWKKVREVEEPEWWERNTAALVRARVEEATIRIHQLSVGLQAFARKQDPDRQVVYFDILCAWELDCGRKLTFSRDAYSDEAKPTGDLIKYFERAANFILGNEAPGRHGIADIIDKYRKSDRTWAADLIVESPDLGTPALESKTLTD